MHMNTLNCSTNLIAVRKPYGGSSITQLPSWKLATSDRETTPTNNLHRNGGCEAETILEVKKKIGNTHNSNYQNNHNN